MYSVDCLFSLCQFISIICPTSVVIITIIIVVDDSIFPPEQVFRTVNATFERTAVLHLNVDCLICTVYSEKIL